MRIPIHSFGIVKKHNSKQAATLATAMIDWLHKKGRTAFLYTAENSSTTEPDLLLIIGGDGTVVSTARYIAGKKIPIMGINLGHVGFLAEFAPAVWKASLETLFEQGVLLEPRTILSYRLQSHGETLRQGLAINDLVLARGAMARLQTLEITVSDQSLGQLRADGVIITSPTGSTGYAGSARGPVLSPDLDVFGLTAICPFLNNFLPLVFKGDAEVVVRVGEGNLDMNLTVDGQELYPVPAGASLSCTGLSGGVVFAKLEQGRHFSKLTDAGFVRVPDPDFIQQGKKK